MKKLFVAIPALLALAGCTALQSVSSYTQGLITSPPQAVRDILVQLLNVLMGVFNGLVSTFFTHLIPPA